MSRLRLNPLDDDLRQPVLMNEDRVEAEIMSQRRREAAAKVRVVIPKKDPSWSGNPQLGNSLPFQPDDTFRQTILKLDEWGPPEIWTVSLGVTVRTDLGALEAFDAIASVSFGAGGATQLIEVDWVDGAQFSLPMNAINVEAVFELGAIGFDVPEGVLLSVLLGRKPIGQNMATRTFGVAVAAGATSDPVRIPNFARSMQIVPRTAADAARIYGLGTFQLRTLLNTVPNARQVIPGTYLLPDTKIPISSASRYFDIVNGGGADLSCQVIFNLLD